jgi:hypothetical protein
MFKRIVIGGVLLVALVCLTLYRRGKADDEVLADMKAVIQSLPSYPPNAEYLDELLEKEHRQAFSASYTTETRQRPDDFDMKKYLEALFERMIHKCKREKMNDVVRDLTWKRDQLIGAVDEKRAARPNQR